MPRTLALVIVALSCSTLGAARPTPEEALVLARAYLGEWQDVLSYLVADEQYAQEVQVLRRTSAGIDQPMAPTKRTLRSEVLLLRAPAEDVWLSFRDVVAVDGKAVPDRQRRFDDLFLGPAATAVSTGKRIAIEGARFNLGRLSRTINTPTAALIFLHSRYERNTTWRLDSNERLNGKRAWLLMFDQRREPFAVTMGRDEPLPASGAFWLEADSGRILQWRLVVRGRATFRVVTTFGPVPSVREGWVPMRMEEEYVAPRFEQMRGTATYSNHRIFRTGARILKPS